MRAWGAFADGVLKLNGRHLPPTVEGLFAFSSMFRSVGTYTNYVGSVAFACELAGVSAAACRDPLLRRAKRAIAHRQQQSRERRFIRRGLLRRLVALAIAEHAPEEAALYILCYAFMLRCASEAMPLVVEHSGLTERSVASSHPAVLQCDGHTARIHLVRRKNAPTGVTLDRECWCSGCSATCPVHAGAKVLEAHPGGAAPFSRWSSGALRVNLRRRLAALGIEHATEYGLHSFRRGHAMDMFERGAGLRLILEAGGWKSCAFALYLQGSLVEKKAVAEAQAENSSDSECLDLD